MGDSGRDYRRDSYRALNVPVYFDAEVSASASGRPVALDLRAMFRDDQSFQAQAKTTL